MEKEKVASELLLAIDLPYDLRYKNCSGDEFGTDYADTDLPTLKRGQNGEEATEGQ